MQAKYQSEPDIESFVVALRKHRFRWLFPTIVCSGLSLAYALFLYHPAWEASQALTVREEATQSAEWSGRFNEAEELKHAQETILELARTQSVVATALRQVGPPSSCGDPEQWPSSEDVASAQEDIEVTPPHGAEFGTTRVFYLKTKNVDRQRALTFVDILCNEVAKRFEQLRNRKSTDDIAELTQAVELARNELQKATADLARIESSVGSDLADLRMLSESMAGDSNLQRTLVEVKQELRQAENARAANQQLLFLLEAAQRDPSHLVATPNRLLESQPALRRLKEGLIDAQLSTSRLLGTMSPEHPQVQASLVAEEEIRGHLHRELEVAIRGLRAEQTLNDSLVSTLTGKMKELQDRMQKLATIRAEYSNQVAEVRQKSESLTRAQHELTSARGGLAAGQAGSLLTRIDGPQTGPYPAGPGKSIIAGAGLVGGLFIGMGFLLLTVPTNIMSQTHITGGAGRAAQREVATAASADVEPATAPGPRPAATHVAAAPTATVPPVAQPPAAPVATAAPVVRKQPKPATATSGTQSSRPLTLKDALARFTHHDTDWN